MEPRGPATAVAAAILATAILLALAAPALDARVPRAGNDPPDTMTRQAYDLNSRAGSAPARTGRW